MTDFWTGYSILARLCLSIEFQPAVNCGLSVSLDESPVLGNKVISEPRQLDSKEKMTYTEQAAKRKHCQRLTRLEIW